MKTRKKRITGLLSLLLVLMFVLSACGNPKQAGNTGETQTAGSATETETNDTETDETPENTTEPTASSGAGRLKMTLNGTDIAYAELTDTPATAEFLEQLPFTIEMHEHLDRQKEVYLPFSLSEESQQNTVYEYEIGDIVYWHPGPTIGDFGYWNAGPDLAIFYDDIYEQTIVEVIPLGHAETGAETIANESGTIRLELVSEEGEQTENE